jgi:hypothetical protein
MFGVTIDEADKRVFKVVGISDLLLDMMHVLNYQLRVSFAEGHKRKSELVL